MNRYEVSYDDVSKTDRTVEEFFEGLAAERRVEELARRSGVYNLRLNVVCDEIVTEKNLVAPQGLAEARALYRAKSELENRFNLALLRSEAGNPVTGFVSYSTDTDSGKPVGKVSMKLETYEYLVDRAFPEDRSAPKPAVFKDGDHVRVVRAMGDGPHGYVSNVFRDALGMTRVNVMLDGQAWTETYTPAELEYYD